MCGGGGDAFALYVLDASKSQSHKIGMFYELDGYKMTAYTWAKHL